MVVAHGVTFAGALTLADSMHARAMLSARRASSPVTDVARHSRTAAVKLDALPGVGVDDTDADMAVRRTRSPR